MKKGRKTNKYKRLKKLLESENPDYSLGLELLKASVETLHPDEWAQLNIAGGYKWQPLYRLEASEIQEYIYDKRKEEGRTLSKSEKATGE